MQPHPHLLMEEARLRQAEWNAAADRARLRAEAARGQPRTSLRLLAAALLRRVADHLEARSYPDGVSYREGSISSR